MVRRQGIAAVLFATAALGLGGCATSTSPPSSTGPVDFESLEGVTSVFYLPRPGQHPVIGGLALTNTDQEKAAILGEVRLGLPQGIYVHSAYVVPLAPDGQTYGFISAPPLASFYGNKDAFQSDLVTWDTRNDLSSYVLGPGEAVNPLILLDIEDPCGGTSEWVEIDYQVGARKYTAVSVVGIALETGDDEIDQLPSGCIEGHPGTPDESSRSDS